MQYDLHACHYRTKCRAVTYCLQTFNLISFKQNNPKGGTCGDLLVISLLTGPEDGQHFSDLCFDLMSHTRLGARNHSPKPEGVQ